MGMMPEEVRSRARNGKPVKHRFVVTGVVEHYVEVHAVDEDDARNRAQAALDQRFGVGRRATITEVERTV